MGRVVPKGLKLREFQKEGVRQIIVRRRTLLADQMGLGKTCQAIVATNVWKPKLIVILCPASLIYNWLREWNMWDVHNRDCFVFGLEQWRGQHVIICSDSIVVTKKLERFLKTNFRNQHICLIGDEAHRYSNWESQRTIKIAVDLLKRAEYFIAITGTPMRRGNASTLHPLLSMCMPDKVGSFENFRDRYTNAYFDGYETKYEGVKNIARLKKLAAGCMVRRFKKDVLKELPLITKIRHDILINRAVATRSLEHASIIDTLLSGGSSADVDLEKHPAFSTVRREVGEEKVPQVVEYIRMLDEAEEGPFVIFAHHRSVVESLYNEFSMLGTAKKLWGGDTPIRKNQVVKEFQAGKIQFLVLSITALSVGVTLTAAHNVILAESTSLPDLYDQAVDRCHRIGATKQVVAHSVLATNSLDEKIHRVLLKRTKDTIKTVG